MPARSESGGFVVRICASGLTVAERQALLVQAHDAVHSHAPDSAHATHGSGDEPASDSGGANEHCPFGVLAQGAAIGAQPLALDLPPIRPLGVVGILPEIAVGRGLAAPPPPATGPPANA